jgi:chemotaxis protein methyltransferase CheR
MTGKLPDTQLSLISELVARHLGLHFPEARWPDLERGLRAAAEECGHRSVEAYLEPLLDLASLHPASRQDQMEVLASHLTIGETYFFREKRGLEILERRIVPDFLLTQGASGKPLRIWSAGCATGEEPYSIAMVVSRLATVLNGCNIEIFGSDVNTKSLHKASEGIYADWSFRGTPAWVRHTYFEAAARGGRWSIRPVIAKMVRFAAVNLMDDAYPPLSGSPDRFDVIFCRNVLMYFTPEGMRRVIRRFHQHLAADGWLIVSPTETSHELFADFATVSFGDITLYRKSDKRSPVTLPLRTDYEYKPIVPQPRRIVASARAFQTSIREAEPESDTASSASVPAETPAALWGKAVELYEQGHDPEAGRNGEAGQTTGAMLAEDGTDAEAMLLLARIDANQGKLAEALGWCDKAIAADKMAARAYYLRATILLEQSLMPKAIAALKQALYAEPQFVLGHFALGNLALKGGRVKESAKHFENVLLLLAQYDAEDIVPESEGLSAGRLREMMAAPGALGAATRGAINAASRGRQHHRGAKQAGQLEMTRTVIR